jgi:hypothetical protein
MNAERCNNVIGSKDIDGLKMPAHAHETPEPITSRIHGSSALPGKLGPPSYSPGGWKYKKWMSTAKASGSTYVEALEYLVGQSDGIV